MDVMVSPAGGGVLAAALAKVLCDRSKHTKQDRTPRRPRPRLQLPAVIFKMLALPRLPPLAAAAGRRSLAQKAGVRAGNCLVRSRPTTTRARLAVRAVAVEPNEVSTPGRSEAEEVARLAAGAGDIYGIPRNEWLALQSPARYLGNEWGAVNKQWSSASVRFTLAYPEVTSFRHPAPVSLPQLSRTSLPCVRGPNERTVACIYSASCEHSSYRRHTPAPPRASAPAAS